MSLFIPPPDNLDWYRQIAFAGQQLFTYYDGTNPVGAGQQVDTGDIYVGNWPAIVVVLDNPGGAGHASYPWDFQLQWKPTGNLGPVEEWEGQQPCTVYDNLPTQGDVLSFTITNNSAVSLNLNATVYGSQSARRGYPGNVNEGIWINQPDFANPSGPETDIFARYFSPGYAWLGMSTTSDDTRAFVMLDLPQQSGGAPQLAVTPPGASPQFFQGVVILPNVQPRMRFVNTTGSAVHQAGLLARAMV